MEKAIYYRCNKIADGIVIKEACTAEEISRFGFELLNSDKWVFDKSSKQLENFLNRLIFINSYNNYQMVRGFFTTWKTNSKHYLSVSKNVKKGGYDIVIGKDMSRRFYPKIKAIADKAIPKPESIMNEEIKELTSRIHAKYPIYRTGTKVQTILSYMEDNKKLFCKYNGKEYYFYDYDTYKMITVDMLSNGKWYTYTVCQN